MKKLLIAFTFLCFLLTLFQVATAQKRKTYKPKTVHVNSYNTKKGKHVRSYKRSKPSAKHTYIIPMVKERGWAV
jgi:hypothetical protein